MHLGLGSVDICEMGGVCGEEQVHWKGRQAEMAVSMQTPISRSTNANALLM